MIHCVWLALRSLSFMSSLMVGLSPSLLSKDTGWCLPLATCIGWPSWSIRGPCRSHWFPFWARTLLGLIWFSTQEIIKLKELLTSSWIMLSPALKLGIKSLTGRLVPASGTQRICVTVSFSEIWLGFFSSKSEGENSPFTLATTRFSGEKAHPWEMFK